MDDSRSIRRLDDVASSHFPRNRDSFFSNFFDKDPFDDPFFTRPFGSLFSSADDFFEPTRQRQHPARLFDSCRQQQEESRGVVIEDVSNDQADGVDARSRTHSEPIVEHPDDIVLPNSDRNRTKSCSQSFSFSSVTYGGPKGSYYKSSTVRQAGDNGLYEEIHEENDSINGRQTNQVVHGLGNKGHSVTRKTSESGVEDYEEILHNLTEDEKRGFDETWRNEAKNHLPGHGKSKALWWKNDNSDHDNGEEQVASQSSTRPTKQLTWKWPWAKMA